MTAHRRDSSVASLIDLGARREAGTAPSVSVHRYWFGVWTVVRVEGEMDLQAWPLIEHLVHDDRFLAFELDAVTFVDASGLGILLSRQRRAREAGGLVQLVEPSAPVRRLLRLTDTERLFPVVPADRAVAVLMATGPGSAFSDPRDAR